MANDAFLLHHQHPEARRLAIEVAEWLLDRGHSVRLPTTDAELAGLEADDSADGDLTSDLDLAVSLGGEVVACPAPEVGLLPVFITEAGAADPVFADLPRELLTLQWHGDTFSLPHGAVLLASSPAYPNQAFRCGRYAYGVQFHLELSLEMAAEWADVRGSERWQIVDGTLCLIDILGFTALSERLAARGRVGAEELTHLLSDVFSRMIERVQDRGGTQLKFGGDALLSLFTGLDHATQAAWSRHSESR